MNYKALSQIAISLISSPVKAWEEIRLEGRRAVFTIFVYSMISLCGLSVFIGALWTNGWGGPQGFQLVMAQRCTAAVALFGGCFLIAYATNQMGIEVLGMSSDIPLVQQLAGYALIVTFLLHIVIGLLLNFSVISRLFQFYTVYVVQERARVVMLAEEKNRLRYTTFSSTLLMLCPAVIQVVFNRLTAILN